jgi:hypothetical protein
MDNTGAKVRDQWCGQGWASERGSSGELCLGRRRQRCGVEGGGGGTKGGGGSIESMWEKFNCLTMCYCHNLAKPEGGPQTR